MRLVPSYRSGSPTPAIAFEQPRRRRSSPLVVIVAVLSLGSLGCASTDRSTWNLRGAGSTARGVAAAPAPAGQGATDPREEPQVTAAFARLEQARNELARRQAAEAMAAAVAPAADDRQVGQAGPEYAVARAAEPSPGPATIGPRPLAGPPREARMRAPAQPWSSAPLEQAAPSGWAAATGETGTSPGWSTSR